MAETQKQPPTQPAQTTQETQTTQAEAVQQVTPHPVPPPKHGSVWFGGARHGGARK